MLEELFTVEQFQKYFIGNQLIEEKYGLQNFNEFYKKFQSKEFQTGLSIWHQIASRKLENVSPYAIAEYISNPPDSLILEINKIINKGLIKDMLFFYGQIDDPSLEFKDFAEILLIVTFNDELLIGDVAFSNPYHPISNPKYIYQTHKGFGYLEEFMEIIDKYCKDHGLKRCFLTAADLDLVLLFEKYGFRVQEDPMSQFALNSGASIPMYKLIE